MRFFQQIQSLLSAKHAVEVKTSKPQAERPHPGACTDNLQHEMSRQSFQSLGLIDRSAFAALSSGSCSWTSWLLPLLLRVEVSCPQHGLFGTGFEVLVVTSHCVMSFIRHSIYGLTVALLFAGLSCVFVTPDADFVYLPKSVLTNLRYCRYVLNPLYLCIVSIILLF